MDDKAYNRVTEIISPFTGIEFVPEDILEKAGKRGTCVHKHVEGILKGESFFSPESIAPYIESFNQFWKKYEHVYGEGKITLEKRLYCDIWKITGQPDVIIELGDRTYIIDWKTSSRVHKSWALQGAAYRYLAELNGYENVDSVLFLKLNKSGKHATLHRYDEYVENLSTFFKCVELYRWFDMDKTRKKSWN